MGLPHIYDAVLLCPKLQVNMLFFYMVFRTAFSEVTIKIRIGVSIELGRLSTLERHVDQKLAHINNLIIGEEQ